MPLFEQDFLKRQIQYLTQLLQEIIFKKKQNKHDEARQQLRDAFQRLTEEYPREFGELTLRETQQLFTNDGEFASELALSVADLLVEEGKILHEQSFSKSQKSYLQALLLYKKSKKDQSSAVPLDINHKIGRLEELLSPSNQVQKVDRIIAENR